jgi:hypothetical protein
MLVIFLRRNMHQRLQKIAKKIKNILQCFLDAIDFQQFKLKQK